VLNGHRRVLVAFVDALGPLQAELFEGALAELPHRATLRGVFGYTSGALPTLLTGQRGDVHGRMCTFRRLREGETSPLAPLRWLGMLPAFVHQRPAVRRAAAKALSHVVGLTGYLDLYRIPPSLFTSLDVAERDDLFTTERVGQASTFLAEARARGLSVYATPWQLDANARFRMAKQVLPAVRPDLTFLYAPELDGVLHRHGNRTRAAADTATRIAEHIEDARRILASDGAEVVTLVVGDHGMANIVRAYHPRRLLDAAALDATFIDSTMLRLWGPEQERERVRRAVEVEGVRGRYLTGAELAVRGVPTTPADYGEAIVILDEGGVFAPSHCGGIPRGMHGYDLHSRAADVALLSSEPIPSKCQGLDNVADLVRSHLGFDAPTQGTTE